jgi:hypothetical protein
MGYALVNKRDLTDINRCHVYLRVLFLLDIVNIQGDTIEEWAINGERRNATQGIACGTGQSNKNLQEPCGTNGRPL